LWAGASGCLGPPAVEDILCARIFEGLDHGDTIARNACYLKPNVPTPAATLDAERWASGAAGSGSGAAAGGRRLHAQVEIVEKVFSRGLGCPLSPWLDGLGPPASLRAGASAGLTGCSSLVLGPLSWQAQPRLPRL
jgi:hypothetical protein